MLLSGNDYYEEILLGHKFRVHMGSFFQVNIPQAEVLYKCASEFTRDAASLLDLYCGAGTIGLSVLSPGQKLTGLDTVADAIRGAKENAQLNGVPNASFILKPAEDIDFTSVSASMPSPLTVIVDPPRKGLADALIRKLLSFRPGKICYISCDPATLARDISQLAGSGSYALTSVQPVDMFPWTHHIEVVAHLTAV
jgi:23S rRNA (uracil1939-C5)-methyltransferase